MQQDNCGMRINWLEINHQTKKYEYKYTKGYRPFRNECKK